MNDYKTPQMCDACHVARPAYKATKSNTDLFFCGHHFDRHEDALLAWADDIETISDEVLTTV